MGHSGWAEWRRFSAAMLALMGAFNAVEGLVVMYDPHAVRVDPARVLLLNLAGWARVTLMLGAVLLALGLWLSVVTLRVRLVALSVVCVHALSQLGVLAALPAWALLMIAFDVVIIFALTATPAGVAASTARGHVDPVRPRLGRPAPAAGVRTAHRPAGIPGGGRLGFTPDDRIGYRPRHEVPAADTTLVLGPPLTDDSPPAVDATVPATAAAVSGTATAPDVPAVAGPTDTAPRALPRPPQQAALDSRPQPASATIVGALARTADAPGDDDAGEAGSGGAGGPAATTAPKRPNPPIIGAISGRWPDVNRK